MKFHLEDRTTRSILGRFGNLVNGKGPLAEEARALKRPHRKGIKIIKKDAEKVMRLHAKGLTPVQIDEKIGKGHGPASIRQIIRNSAQYLHKESITPFTPEEDALLVQLVFSGSRWIEIAKRFPSKSRKALQQRWHIVLQPSESIKAPKEANEEPRPWLQQDVKTVLEMYKQGKTTRTIATKVPHSVRQVRTKLNSFGLVKQGSKYFDAAAANAVLESLQSRESNAPRTLHPEESAKIKELASSGMSVSKIARTVGQNTGVIKYWIGKQDVDDARRAWTFEEEGKLKALVDGGEELAAIAEELGRSKSSVQGKIHKIRNPGVTMLDASSRSFPWSSEEDQRCHEMFAEGKPVRAIARELGRTEYAVAVRISRWRKSGKILESRKTRRTTQDTQEEETRAEAVVDGKG